MGKIKNPSRWMSKGFSIIEVISAIIILSIMASLSVNVMSDYKLKQNITNARQQLTNAMTSAMAAAQRDNVTYVVVYDKDSHKLKACIKGSCGATNDSDAAFSYDLSPYSQPVLFYGASTNNAIDLDDSKNFIMFTPFGKIQVSDSLKGLRSGEYYRLFLRDKKGKITDSDGINLCVGLEFTHSGSIGSIERGTSEGACN